jgi:hypothetical protein
MLLSLWLAAHAAEVVWLEPTQDPALIAWAAVAAGASGVPLSPDQLRAAAGDFGPADAEAWTALDQTLKEVRAFETRLDGELVILRDLERPLAGIGVLRDLADRDRLYGALIYQGFAAWRFYGEGLDTDPDAAPWRAPLHSGAAPRPWANAVALDPERRPDRYELAEVPARAAFEGFAPRLVAEQLPALVVVGEVPEGVQLVVDGRITAVGPSRQVRLLPGRHLAHLQRDGHILERFDLTLEAGAETTLQLSLSDADWDAWLMAVRAGELPPTPEGLVPALIALGGDVLLARPRGASAELIRVTEAGSERVVAERAVADSGGTKVGVAVGGGWMSSGDFYVQDPVNVEATRGAVNSGAFGGLVEVHLSTGLFRAGVSLDQVVTLGADHVALTGDSALRYRPAVLAGVGVTWVQAVGGFQFPYHPVVGAHATIPVKAGVEIVGSFLAGLPMTLTRDNGTEYTTLPTYTAWAGVGYRFGAGMR